MLCSSTVNPRVLHAGFTQHLGSSIVVLYSIKFVSLHYALHYNTLFIVSSYTLCIKISTSYRCVYLVCISHYNMASLASVFAVDLSISLLIASPITSHNDAISKTAYRNTKCVSIIFTSFPLFR